MYIILFINKEYLVRWYIYKSLSFSPFLSNLQQKFLSKCLSACFKIGHFLSLSLPGCENCKIRYSIYKKQNKKIKKTPQKCKKKNPQTNKNKIKQTATITTTTKKKKKSSRFGRDRCAQLFNFVFHQKENIINHWSTHGFFFCIFCLSLLCFIARNLCFPLQKQQQLQLSLPLSPPTLSLSLSLSLSFCYFHVFRQRFFSTRQSLFSSFFVYGFRSSKHHFFFSFILTVCIYPSIRWHKYPSTYLFLKFSWYSLWTGNFHLISNR